MSAPVAFELVAAADDRLGIGRRGGLPWRLPGEMKHFRTLTRSTRDPSATNAVVMGRVTWESIPQRFRPLRGRVNAVVSTRTELALPDGVVRSSSVEGALERAASAAGEALERVFVIGGARVYERAVDLPGCRDLHLTRVAGDFDCDAFFPALEGRFERAEIVSEAQEHGIDYRIERWRRV